jgi:hypothetical protein
MRICVLAAIIAVAVVGLSESPAFAADGFVRVMSTPCAGDPAPADPWMVNWTTAAGGTPAAPSAPAIAPVDFGLSAIAGQAAPGRRRPVAFEYSEGYKLRARIHKAASIATLPLFVAEYLVGQNLYNHPGSASGSARGAHGALAGSIGVLFGVNTITGVWNLVEARKDPNRRTRRTIHGVLMLLADAGFVATGATAPESEHERGGVSRGDGGSRSTHRTLALTSMGIATVSYLIMLVGGN